MPAFETRVWSTTVPLASAAGAAAALGGLPLLPTAGVAGGTLALAAWTIEYRRPYMAQVELPLVLLLLSTLDWRVRGPQEAQDLPLDVVALARIGLIAAAGTLALMAYLLSERRQAVPLPLGLYLGFGLAASIAVPLSPNPPLSAFWVIGLLTAALVVITAVRTCPDAISRMTRVAYLFAVTMVLSIWLGVIVSPGHALVPVDSYGPLQVPLPDRVQGVVPSIASDEAGFFGAIVFVWSLGTAMTRQQGRRVGHLALAGLGLATVVAAQWRTGYVAAPVAAAVLLAYLRRPALGGIVAAAGIAFVLFGSAISELATALWLRGQSPEVASSLTGRTELWDGAIQLWGESPVFGNGLIAAARADVLLPMGLKTASTLHSSWLEALVGTGVLGTALLASSVVVTGYRAIVKAMPIASALLVVLVVKSTSLPAFEVIGYASVLFLVLACQVSSDTEEDRSPQ